MRIQALGRLIQTEAPKVIPLLRDIVLEGRDPGAARRALFVLARSRNPEAQSTVADVAKAGPEPVRVAAVRELARFGGAEVSGALLDVYSHAQGPVKQQVVLSLGDRADTSALFRIVQTEPDEGLRDAAILSLGRAGGREQLRGLLARSSRQARRSIVRAMFLARDEDGLMRAASEEKDPGSREEIRQLLRLLGTPGAKQYLESRQ